MSYFNFSLGPVQGFVAQARRTRDFWAGSFLLSYLTAHAMKAVQAQGGEIVMPDVEGNALLTRVIGGVGDGPKIGSLPNCFEAEVLEAFKGELVADSVRKEWRRIADHVWLNDNLAAAKVSRDLWDEQINNYWEIAWVISGTDAEISSAVRKSMRKNWRTHYPIGQAGDKCTMMGEWQELSGVAAPHRENQKQFWGEVRRQKNISQLELRDGERLCAIAYVKRRFVHAWAKINDGWELPSGVPSTSYMAATHWLEKLICAEPDASAMERLCNAAKGANVLGERLTRIECISKALREHPAIPREIADIDGRLLYDNELRQLAEPGKTAAREINLERARDIRSARDEIVKSIRNIDDKFPKEPSPFYALLLMDGDSLSTTMNAMGGDASRLSSALREFTDEVIGAEKFPGIVQASNGFLVYAGGDDVLALLPLEDALECALKLRETYMRIFAGRGVEAGKYSISASLIFAHMKLPLTMVLKDSHRLLDDVAKEKTGRDAIAVRVWKPGGEAVTWAARWGDGGDNVTKLCGLASSFQTEEDGEPGHASKPLFRIHERLEMLGGGSDFTEDQIKQLLVAEYATSGVLKTETRTGQPSPLEIAGERINKLLPLCKKNMGEGYRADAAMLLRFLAQKGMER